MKMHIQFCQHGEMWIDIGSNCTWQIRWGSGSPPLHLSSPKNVPRIINFTVLQQNPSKNVCSSPLVWSSPKYLWQKPHHYSILPMPTYLLDSSKKDVALLPTPPSSAHTGMLHLSALVWWEDTSTVDPCCTIHRKWMNMMSSKSAQQTTSTSLALSQCLLISKDEHIELR